MASPYDFDFPGYDRYYGFAPCRLENCGEEIHPYHERTRPSRGRPIKPFSGTPAEQRPRKSTPQTPEHACSVCRKTGHDVRTCLEVVRRPPEQHAHVPRTAEGHPRCPACDGRGWHLGRPCDPCEVCLGRAFLRWREYLDYQRARGTEPGGSR